MSDVIKWSELTSDQRDEVIHKKVLGHAHKTRDAVPLRVGSTAFISAWQRGETEVLRYTTSLDAIKPLRQRMAERFPLLNLHLIVYAYNRCYAAFSDSFEYDDWVLSEGNGEHCMEEAICKAALRACGVEVES